MDETAGVIRKTHGTRIYEIRLTEHGEISSCYQTESGSKVWAAITFFQLPLTLQLEIINELSRSPRDTTLFPKKS